MAGSSPSPVAALVAARDEEERIAATVAALRGQFPTAAVVVADDGSRDETAAAAAGAGAIVLRRPRLGKGEALNAAERAAPPGPVVLCDADLVGDVRPLAAAGADLAIAVFREPVAGGFGVAKRTAGRLIAARCGLAPAEPLSGQRYLSERARAACFPLARGFGCELRMTVDAVRAGLAVREVVLPLSHRATARDLPGFAHRGRQLADAVLGAGPLQRNHRGNRLPIVGWLVPFGVRGPGRTRLAVALAALAGLADDVWSGPERGWRSHLVAGRTTGVLKLVAIPLAGLVATRSLSAALLVGLCANAINQLDTAPGRALKACLLVSILSRETGAAVFPAVLLLPYDLRERGMLGDAGSNALGAVLGLGLVARLDGRGRWAAIVTLAGLNLLGDRVSFGRLIEAAPAISALDRAGRVRG